VPNDDDDDDDDNEVKYSQTQLSCILLIFYNPIQHNGESHLEVIKACNNILSGRRLPCVIKESRAYK
jgi:hypothetical protein